MPEWLAGIELVHGPLRPVLEAVALLALVVALVRRPVLRSAALVLLGGGVGVLVGLGLTWLLADRLNLFEVDLSPLSRMWIDVAFAGAGAQVVALARRGRAWRRAVAATGLVVSLLLGALGVNADFGQYPTIGSIAGVAVAPPVAAAVLQRQAALAPGDHGALGPGRAIDLSDSAVPADQPAHGLVGTVAIPATVSHFPARRAYVYLPPRALVADPPALPVLMLLSGQPGGPDTMVRSGQVRRIADDYAAAHRGLAPIIVIPDQLSQPQINPMCLDSPIGDSATYLTVDVRHWILTHLDVQTTVGAWSIGGFSQGGTCTIQLGAGHPELFGGLLDISGQVAPFSGSVAHTIAVGFGGSRSAYQAALPESLLAAHAPYRHVVAVFTSGSLDAKYGPGVTTIADAARRAGMDVTRLVSPGTAHDWSTVRWSLRNGLPTLAAHLGLGGLA